MPDPRRNRGSAKSITVSEVKLDVPPATIQSLSRAGSIKKEQPNKNVSGALQRAASIKTISIQNVEIPTDFTKKPYINPKCPTFQVVPPDCKVRSQNKMRVNDQNTSSSNRLDGWVLAIPQKFTHKCSATSSNDNTSSSIKTESTKKSSSQATNSASQNMIDTMHKGSKKQLNFKGPEWLLPCKESFVAGAPQPFIGTCPVNASEFAKLSKSRQKFFLTKDPRKTHCLRNPQVLRKKAYSTKKEFNALTKMVKQADNICSESASQSSESFICDVIDKENPLQLDFQGMDYMKTYERDEQEVQNQRIYRRVLRFVEKKRVKDTTEANVENELQQERLAVPQAFNVINRKEVPVSISEESIHFGKLFRSIDKPHNKQVLADEQKRRIERYKELYHKRKAKADAEKEAENQQKQYEDDNLATTIMLENFNTAVVSIDDAIRRTFRQERKLKRKEVKRRIYPHTLRETLNFRKDLKTRNRIKRDEAKVRTEFFRERLGKIKKYPEAELDISSETAKHSSEGKISEQSSDDEDALKVGKSGDIFKLRGFQFQLGEGLRGKLSEKERTGTKGQRRQKGCITREQWLSQLAPKKERIRLDVEIGIEKIKNPDDPEMVLFRPHFGFKVPKAETSAVKQYREKRLGRQYHRLFRKKLKLLKPKPGYSVKKFNLIRYLFGDDDKVPELQNPDEDLEKVMKLKSTQEYIEGKARLERKKKEKMKHKRLELLGVPCKTRKKSRLQTLCENSESESDSDWVPEREPDLASEDEELRPHNREGRIPLRMRGNMPAPLFRDKTLRRHPRHPRDYFGQRVPSALFDHAVKTTGIPHMYKMDEDKKTYMNVRMKKRPYTTMFGARHHYDHWNPTQQKIVDVHYQANIVTSDITRLKNRDKQVIENFLIANPPCNAFVDMDLTMPNWNIESMIADQLGKSKYKTMETAKERTKDICHARDFVFHSRNEKENEKFGDFPGHQEYMQFLHEIRQQLQETKDNDTSERLFVDREAFINELEEDLKSIESCLTSLTSSICTNLTNDSGSFLLVQGKTKVPLDYIRNSLVPFEELQNSRFQFEPIDVEAEEADPFRVMPFAGQKKEQIEIMGPKDSFFTFNTRLQSGLRLRLEIPIEDVRQKLLGRGANKYPGAVTTDIDEDYVTELKNRPSVKMFNFKSGRSMIKDALRLKFESMLIQGQIVRTKIYDRLNEQHWEQMQRTKMLYEKLFAKWEKKEYEASMAVVYKVKTYYDMTDVLKREYRELEKQSVILNMDIVYIEGDWIRRIMLQNFHYLLADTDWRYMNDWIHRINDEDDEQWELENFEDSIAKRTTVNIRQREKDDAWAIKTFYEENYLQNKHELLIVFPDAESFLKGIENLKVKTFVLLLELHFTLSIHTELQGRLETFEEWCIQDLKEKEEYVARKSAKKFFMINRADELMTVTKNFVQAPIEKSFLDDHYIRDRAVITEVWREIVPANIRGSSDKDLEPVDMVAMMADVVLELLSKFETVSVTKSRKIELALRKSRTYLRKVSYQAYQIEKRIEIEMKKVVKNLEPPYKKPKRVGKLPRLFIKKKKISIVKPEKHISEHTKFFFRAFHDEGDVTQLDDARESLYVMDNIQDQIVPFYFDHFLKLNGYTPSYNFKTQIEIRDGPEVDRCEVRHILPEIVLKMDRWEMNRRKIKEENISRNPKMYENVNF